MFLISNRIFFFLDIAVVDFVVIFFSPLENWIYVHYYKDIIKVGLVILALKKSCSFFHRFPD